MNLLPMDFGCSKTRDFIEFQDISDSVSVPPLHKHGTIFFRKAFTNLVVRTN